MSEFAFTPPATPSLAVFGSNLRFPIRRVFCVGRNYATHAREMGSDPDREPPFFFMKPADAVVPAEGALPYPPATQELHHEIELVVALRSGGADIPADEALTKVWGYGVGLDLTRRDLQAAAKEAGRPWDMAKGFDASAPCTPLRPVSAFGHPSPGACIRMTVNGETRQDGSLDEMIWPIADIISHLSRLVTLAPGDLIFTGTPGGVGALLPGDRVHGEVAGVDEFDLEIVDKS
ncbi:fumarylacetoacetate hydrolase family protein [Massilia niabensis]|uniref:Fumarylacetoacetate hydrolase family protein n=1 Tax=Massilia niabensis TaxID=544910 RepID=A0ABW0KYL2_9BURK